MDNTSQDFGIFIDNIRSSRNMSKEDFVEGILSTRQFQRYLKGESSISIDKILKLIDKLELEFFTIYNLFLKSSSFEYNMINEIYYHIMSLEFKEAFEIIEKYEAHNFISLYEKKLFDIYSIITKHKLLRISRDMAINSFEESIDYDKVMKNGEITYIELTALLYLVQIVHDKSKQHSIMTKLFIILKSHKITDFDEKNSKMVFVYSVFSGLLGTIEKYDEVIYIAKKGINLCEIHKTMNSLSQLYYYCALAYKEKRMLEKSYTYIRKAFFTLELENNPLKYQAFIKLFESHYSMNFTEFKTWK
ncbi:MAG: helix-turn-helix transcriptional regulator [Candidatus Izimaplasma sp.]|nr:helix-turn-helix transcriptional regulator [Candidatus Izimaplasma bacterium]